MTSMLPLLLLLLLLLLLYLLLYTSGSFLLPAVVLSSPSAPSLLWGMGGGVQISGAANTMRVPTLCEGRGDVK